jgi:hypothetical protein
VSDAVRVFLMRAVADKQNAVQNQGAEHRNSRCDGRSRRNCTHTSRSLR